MGFSTKPDEGYNLGGVNIQCLYDDNYEQYDPWLNGNAANVKTKGSGSFAANYGILLGVLVVLSGFIVFAWKHVGSTGEQSQAWDQMQSGLVERSGESENQQGTMT